MQALMRLRLRLSDSNSNLFRLSSYLYSSYSQPNSLPSSSHSSYSTAATNLFTAPWSSIQRRGVKVSGSDIRVGNIIGKQGRIYEVLKVDHSHEGRGKATIKVELRDIGQGNKVTQRMGTDEDIEIYHTMLLGARILDEMKVKVQFYDDKPLSASVPKRVTCIVKEGIAATPRNKKVILDNGLTVEVPPHIVAGDAIVVNTEDDSYIERAKG